MSRWEQFRRSFLPAGCYEGRSSPWRHSWQSDVVRTFELIPSTVCLFRTKGKTWQPPLAWYLDGVLENSMNNVSFLADLCSESSSRSGPLGSVLCHLNQWRSVELQSGCFLSHGKLCAVSPHLTGYVILVQDLCLSLNLQMLNSFMLALNVYGFSKVSKHVHNFKLLSSFHLFLWSLSHAWSWTRAWMPYCSVHLWLKHKPPQENYLQGGAARAARGRRAWPHLTLQHFFAVHRLQALWAAAPEWFLGFSLGFLLYCQHELGSWWREGNVQESVESHSWRSRLAFLGFLNC